MNQQKHTNKYLSLLFLTLMTISCKRSLDEKICYLLDESTKNTDSAIIKLNSINDFSWDTLYAFGGIESAEEILANYHVKITINGVNDDGVLYVFMKNGKSVHEKMLVFTKCYFHLPLGVGMSRNTNYKVYRLLSLHQVDSEHKYHYYLKPIE